MKTRKEQSSPIFDWQRIGNSARLLTGALRRVLVLREGGLTRFWVLTIYHYGAFIVRLRKSSGSRGVVIYLKGCHVLLNQVVAGQRLDNPRRLGCAISRTRSGLPRVIPILHRRMILSGDKWTVRLWSSFFWLYRVLDTKGKIKLSTITKPFEVSHVILREWVWWLIQFLPIFFDMLGRKGTANVVRARSRSPLKKGVSLLPDGKGVSAPEYITMLVATVFPYLTERQVKDPARRELANSPLLKELKPGPIIISKSGPNSAKGPDEGPGPNTRTSTGSILTDILCWLSRPNLLSQIRKLWPEAVNFGLSIIAQAEGVYREIRASDMYGKTIHEEGNAFSWLGTTPLPGFSYGDNLGKLGFLPEPAGKIRVFAMVDSLTQMLLKPLHDAIFEVLRKIPQDGTHDQHAPARNLAEYGLKHFWSYDLSAATDRFPISLQQALLAILLGPEVARAWRSILVDREYKVPRFISDKQRVPRSTPVSVQYGAGQPMGAYTSWAVFALTHHFLVQYAHWKAYGKLEWFCLYALLGDDVVIAEGKVAKNYLLLLREIGVEVGLAKSLISSNGTFEFAKRTYRSGVDLSGISLEMMAASVTDATVLETYVEAAQPRGVKHALRLALQVLGYGGKALCGLPNLVNLRSRLQGLAVLFTRPGSTWGLTPEAWLTQKRVDFSPPLSNESAREILVDVIRQKLVAEAEKLAQKRDLLLLRLNNPRVQEFVQVRPSPDLKVQDEYGKSFWLPHYEEDTEPLFASPYMIQSYSEVLDSGQLNNKVLYFSKLLKFLTDWVTKPQVKSLQSINIEEVLTHLDEWKHSNPVEDGFSLDEVYRSLDTYVDELSGVETEINKLRRSHVDLDRKRSTKVRTRAVKFWRGCRPVLASRMRGYG